MKLLEPSNIYCYGWIYRILLKPYENDKLAFLENLSAPMGLSLSGRENDVPTVTIRSVVLPHTSIKAYDRRAKAVKYWTI